MSTQRKLTRAEKKQIEAAIARAKQQDKKKRSAQDSIPFERMWPDGICRVKPGYFTKTIQFQDINYQLNQNEDKTAIFEGWCDFLNYFDSSVKFQLSFMNMAANKDTYGKSIVIPPQDDDFDNIRQGFISVCPSWSGMNAEALQDICTSVYDDEEFAVLQHKAKILRGDEHGNVDSLVFHSYEAPPGVYFMNQRTPSLTISKKSIKLSKSCRERFTKHTHIEILYHPVLQVIAFRGCSADTPNAGDVGANYYGNKRDQRFKQALNSLGPTLFCVYGNHEQRPNTFPSYLDKSWRGGSVWFEEAYPNLLFPKDGEIFTLAGLQHLVIGGAYSVDKFYRLSRGYGWWSDEQPSEEIKAYVEKQIASHKIDVVLSHTCPYKYEPTEVFLPFIDQSTVDASTEHWLTFNLKATDQCVPVHVSLF